MQRLFVGIPVPEAYGRQLATLSGTLAGRLDSTVRWTRPENGHLTLQFLGETPVERVDAVADALGGVRFLRFRLRAGGHGCFPHCGKPRILRIGMVEGGEQCVSLATLVHDVMDPFGYKRGNRFTPHLTLGRVKKPAEDDWEGVLAESETEWPAFTVDRFILWESDLRPDGPVYSVIREFPLVSD